MTLCERRILALYQRLWRENQLLLGLLRGGCALAQAERILADSAPRRSAPAWRARRQNVRRIVV